LGPLILFRNRGLGQDTQRGAPHTLTEEAKRSRMGCTAGSKQNEREDYYLEEHADDVSMANKGDLIFWRRVEKSWNFSIPSS